MAAAEGSAFPLPLDTVPMEAKRAQNIPDDGAAWQYEPKWDGFRCLAFKSRDEVDIRGKSGKPLGRYFPELLEQLRKLAASHLSSTAKSSSTYPVVIPSMRCRCACIPQPAALPGFPGRCPPG